LLAKNGETDAARTVIATLDRTKAPAIGSFVDWFEARFDAQASLPPAELRR